MEDTSTEELLMVMLDTCLLLPGSACEIKVDIFLQQMLIFLRAHQLLSELNHQCVMALTHNSTPVLITPESCISSARPAVLLERLTSLLATHPALMQQQGDQRHHLMKPVDQDVALSAGLSRALCYINRHLPRFGQSTAHRARPRILIIMSSADMPLQYIPTMNAIFAAQSSNVILDALVLGHNDSAFLQQATHLTSGLYMRASDPGSMLQYLLGAFSADSATRQLLSVSGGNQVVDYRASCFCHKQIIDTGYICSVCLSIFCKANMRATQCLTCGAPFKKKGAEAAAAAGHTDPAAAAAGDGAG